jgi:hypothetical protein
VSAIEETNASAVGKSTQGSSQLSVGDATRMLAVPQAPYADAVYAALELGLAPDVMEVGLRDTRPRAPELIIRLVWTPGHPVLGGGHQDAGLTVAWSHVTGWSAHNAYGAAELLDVDALAAPELVADAARHHARHGVGLPWVPPADGRWSEAVYLDIALGLFEEKGGSAW